MARNRQTIALMPTAGLTNNGPHARIPENALWELEDAEVDLAGLLIKRRGLTQWGRTFKEPASGGLRYAEIFNDLSHFTGAMTTPNASIIASESRVRLETTGLGAGTETVTISRMAQSNDGTTDNATQMSMRFLMRSNGALPANPGAGNDYGPTLGIRDSGANPADATTVAFFAEGIHIRSTAGGGTFVVVANTDIDDSRWHVVELRFTGGVATGTMDVFVDDVQQGTAIVVTNYAGYPINASQVTLRARLNPVTKYAVEFDLVQGRSKVAAPFTAIGLTELMDWRSANPVHKQLLAVAGNQIYVDTDHIGVFRGLDFTANFGLTTFVPYLEKLIILHPSLLPRQWGGTGVPTSLSTAPLAGFGTEHKGRLFLVGNEQHPLRVYFSGANNLADWFTEVGGNPTTSGFFDIPDRRGARITAIMGNFYGDLIVWTQTSVWRVTGNFIVLAPADYTLLNINTSVGCVGPRAVTRLSNDIEFMSQKGLHTIVNVQAHGDLQENFLTNAIRNRWKFDTAFDLKNVLPSYESVVRYHPEEDRTYFGIQLEGDVGTAHVFLLNHAVEQISGPLSIPGGVMEYVRLSFPELPVMMVGSSTGQVGQLLSDNKSNYLTDAYTFRMRSAKLDGRSLDPAASCYLKNWKELRLFVMPRSSANITLRWQTDEETNLPTDTVTTQNLFNAPVLDDNFVLDESKLFDSQTVGVLVVPLDMNGRWLQFTAEQANASEDLIVVGAEVDFQVDRSVKENG